MLNTFYQAVSCALVFGPIYIFFASLGARDNSLLYSREQKLFWDSRVGERFRIGIVLTNIFGSLTSFPTVAFLFGAVKQFGWFAALTSVTIFLGAIFTNRFTRPVQKSARVSALVSSSDQLSGVTASLFWSDDGPGKRLSATLKSVSLLCIFSLVWLDFFTFAEMTNLIYGGLPVLSRVCVMGLLVFITIYFVLQFGIRGFVSADFFLSPLIGICAVALLILVMTHGAIPKSADQVSSFFQPSLSDTVLGIPFAQCWVFAVHVFLLNGFQILCSEPHWFRVWLLGNQETKSQSTGAALTGAGWLLMLPVGFFAFASSSPGAIGDQAIVNLLFK